jgi:hypothetical protein
MRDILFLNRGIEQAGELDSQSVKKWMPGMCLASIGKAGGGGVKNGFQEKY